MSTKDFSQLNLTPEFLGNLKDMGFQEMTSVQARSLPCVLEGRDLVAQAKTGSGKTAVFGIGLLSTLDVRSNLVQALVLCPTRELADQVGTEIRRLAKFAPNVKILTLCGGKPMRPQIASLAFGAHIVVGTPGRIYDHLERETLGLGHIKTLVFDEADRMLDLGFKDAIADIVKFLPKERQTLLFSATFPPSIAAMSASIQNDPVVVRVESLHSAESIAQSRYLVQDDDHRLKALLILLQHYNPASGIVFCTTKEQCRTVAKELQASGFRALAIHGDLEQRERDDVLVRFTNKSCAILVATDVASRGLHISDVSVVVNFQLPRDPEVYVHRIGRTGRAGAHGFAFSLYKGNESRRVAAIESYQKTPIALAPLPKGNCTQAANQPTAAVVTLKIAGGKRNKLSKGDILGALTRKDSGISGANVGRIDIFEFHSCVAIDRGLQKQGLQTLANWPIKGRSFKVQLLS